LHRDSEPSRHLIDPEKKKKRRKEWEMRDPEKAARNDGQD
jgi:hypothetical protein